MPKDTYFNLPEAKRKRIFDAAINEIISVPIHEVSINRIVQSAGISRGSFYQYFDDKQDLIQFVLSDGIKFIKNGIDRIIEQSKGDIFSTAMLILEGVFSLGQKEIYRKTLRNILVECSAGECSYRFILQLQMEILDQLEKTMCKETLCIQEEQEYRHLVKIVFVLLKEAAISYLYEGKEVELHREEFRSQLNMIKEGVLRKG